VCRVEDEVTFANITSNGVDAQKIFLQPSVILDADQVTYTAGQYLTTSATSLDPKNSAMFGTGTNQGASTQTGYNFASWLIHQTQASDQAYNTGNPVHQRNTKGRVACDKIRMKLHFKPIMYIQNPNVGTGTSWAPLNESIGLDCWWAHGAQFNLIAGGSVNSFGQPKLTKAKPDANGVYHLNYTWRNTLPKKQRWIMPQYFSNNLGAQTLGMQSNCTFPYAAGRYLSNKVDMFSAPAAIPNGPVPSVMTGMPLFLDNQAAINPYVGNAYADALRKGMPASDRDHSDFPRNMVWDPPCLRIEIPGANGDPQPKQYVLSCTTSYEIVSHFRGNTGDWGVPIANIPPVVIRRTKEGNVRLNHDTLIMIPKKFPSELLPPIDEDGNEIPPIDEI